MRAIRPLRSSTWRLRCSLAPSRAAYPNLRRPRRNSRRGAVARDGAACIQAGGVAAPVVDNWMETFADPALAALVIEALAHAISASAARVQQAAGYVKGGRPLRCRWAYLPPAATSRAAAAACRGSSSVRAGLDVWGRLRYGSAAAQGSRRPSRRTTRTRQSLAATVAKELVPGHRGGPSADRAERVRSSGRCLASAGAPAHRQRQRAGRGAGKGDRRHYRDTLRQISRREGGRCVRSGSGRTLSGSRDRRHESPVADAASGARRDAATSRTPTGRGRGGAPRRRR